MWVYLEERWSLEIDATEAAKLESNLASRNQWFESVHLALWPPRSPERKLVWHRPTNPPL